MKTLLVVEDEKMIRRGICTIAKRSGVEIEEILECGNGEEALEIVKSRNIDVLFTDIRMPKMDGIELVKEINTLENKPIIVAISGYDDFSYAVEMMRNGVREYILKPVDRDKICSILTKIEAELADNSKKQKAEQDIGRQQIKYLLTNEPESKEEIETLKAKYDGEFFGGEYVVCCGCRKNDRRPPEGEEIIFIPGVGDSDVFIIEREKFDGFLTSEFEECYLGISRPNKGIENLREAYMQACEARRAAFCMVKSHIYGDEEARVPEVLIKQAAAYIEDAAMSKRLQLIGTGKTDELIAQWDRFFISVERRQIKEEHFEAAQERFIEDAGRTYRTSLTEEDYMELQMFRHTLLYPSIIEYRDAFMNWILKLNENIGNRDDTKQSDRKMQQALAYIKENYNSDINMAVVSNYISMNYSLFSFSFKQYTGMNFVNYLKNLRMDEAKRMLAETDMKVIEISQCVGYDNEKHFMKIFKNEFGVSPSEYRKNMQR